MTRIVRYDAFDRPLDADAVDDEVLMQSDQAPVALALTPDCASETGRRLVKAARTVRAARKAKKAKRGRRPAKGD